MFYLALRSHRVSDTAKQFTSPVHRAGAGTHWIQLTTNKLLKDWFYLPLISRDYHCNSFFDFYFSNIPFYSLSQNDGGWGGREGNFWVFNWWDFRGLCGWGNKWMPFWKINKVVFFFFLMCKRKGENYATHAYTRVIVFYKAYLIDYISTLWSIWQCQINI